MNIKDMIEERADSLSPQLRQAADFVAANPIEVSFRSMRYIAGKTGLAPPTFSRLARSLGFDSYESLKDACRLAAKDTYSGYHDRAEALRVGHAAGDDSAAFHVAYGQQSMRNINETMVNTGPAVIERVAQLALGARRVFINAQMGQRHIGSYAGYVASLAFDNWDVLGVEPSSIASQVRRLGTEDVMICLSVMPYATATLSLATAGREAGCRIVAITDSPESPLSAISDETLLAATANQHFFASQIGALYLLEAIIGLMVAKSGETIQANLQKTELFSRLQGEYTERPQAANHDTKGG
ncbi:MAG: MurR/RpiR family transcriptional regulator [Candidatus Puniceispirillaceae bacterium]